MTAFLILSIFLGQAVASQPYTQADYIQMYKGISMKEMRRSGIPASITLAQGILESRSGNSRLAIKANNHFGIKCHSSWSGKKIYGDDDKKHECFRVYKNAQESFIDHSKFLTSQERYAFLFKLRKKDYKGWAHGLKKAGYATNPKYPRLLIDLIEKHKLYQYDSGGGGTIASSTDELIIVFNGVNIMIPEEGDNLRNLDDVRNALKEELGP